MSEPRVEVRISGADVRIEFDGFEGNACVAAREEIRKALERLGISGTVTARTAKHPDADVPLRGAAQQQGRASAGT